MVVVVYITEIMQSARESCCLTESPDGVIWSPSRMDPREESPIEHVIIARGLKLRKNTNRRGRGSRYKKAEGNALALQVSLWRSNSASQQLEISAKFSFCCPCWSTKSKIVRFSRPLVTASVVRVSSRLSSHLAETSPNWGLILLLRFCPFQRFENSAAKS